MDRDDLASRFEAHRDHLRAVAYRMLGSLDEADDVLQQAWFRADRADLAAVDNIAGWLTTVVARICLDALRSRRLRNEVPLTAAAEPRTPTDPEHEAALANAVGHALLVVMDRLSPAERVAFVLHDAFAVPFDEIAAVVGRSPAAAKKLASRARGRVNGEQAVTGVDLARHDAIVTAFLTAARGGDLATLIDLLAPDVVRRAYGVPAPTEVRGAAAVAEETQVFAAHAAVAQIAMVDGRPGIVVAPFGHLHIALRIEIDGDRITRIDVVGDPAMLASLPVHLRPAQPG